MAENADKIKALHRKRGVILGGITSFSKKLDEWRDKEVDRDKYVLQQYLDSFVKGFDKFDPIQEELEDLDEREIDQRQVIQDRFDVAVARAKGLLSEYAVSDDGESTRSNNSASFQSAASSQNSDRHVKLPKIDLPKFDGTLENWASFYDLFSTLIDEDTALSASAKLHFLRSSCTGKAARLIESLTTKPENYESALKLLKKKFDSPRRALRAHWTKLREYPKSPKDTPTSLGELVDLFNQNLKAMENLGAPVDQWSVPLIDLILTKISPYTAWQWELTLDETDNKMPCYTHLLSFLERRASSVELSNFDSACKNVAKVSYRSNYNNNSSPVPSVKKPAQNFSATSAPAKSDKKKTCPLCSEPHPLYWCDQFKSMSTEDRKITAQRESLCMNCLGNHTGLCKSKHRCKICKNNTHHTLLCCQNSEKPQPESPKFAGVINTPTSELITTALVNVSNYDGKSVLARALVDTCSSMHFMTINLAQRLGLKVRKDPSPISVLNSITTISGGTVSAIIRSRYNGYERELTFRTVDQITGLVPDQPIDRRLMKIPSNIRLADPEFHRPAPAEILIASGTALSMLCQGQINLSQPGGLDLYLQKTMLGWVIGGSVPSESAQSMASCHLVTLNFDLKQFWEREEVPQMEVLTKCKNEEEALCEEHFRSNITRNSEGRYVVALPFNERVTELRESRSMAEKRLAGLKRRLQLNPELKEKYCSVMKEYLTLGHMSPVEVRGGEKGYYLPHHAVTKDSLTTAVRVVYDGSAKTFPDGPSLNETLRVGPTIQPDLFSQLLKFRIHNTVLTGDIEKMYRQFLVRKQDRKYQRILWPDAEGRTQTYELNTVTFGLAPASFLAIRCLHQLAEDEGKNFPLAAEVLKNEFYVDNALTGAPTVTAAVLLRQQLTEILSRAGINIYQWASNVPEVLHDLPPEKINKQLVLSNSTISTLGLKWDANSDSITYTVANLPLNHIVTKRSILSEISKIFDPLGLLGPVIIYAKILIQELWKLKLHWDESLTSSLRQVWLKYRHQLSLLDHLSFGRKILIEHPVRVELHSFGDAGTKAYGCCLYVRSIDVHGNILTTLLCAKSRVAPIKTVSIPRLELCAARLLADDNHVTRLLIEAEHTIHGHAGIQATLYALRRRFWVLDGRNTIRKILRQCVHCAKLKPVSVDYLMGDLPAARVTPARPFSRVGIDLCGYFFLKEKKYRNRNQVKAYVVVFVCFVTKAVHLELVTDLSSDSFIAALRRFIARRGLCSDIYSDNATNFLGTNNQMKELETLFSDSKHQNSVHAFAAKNCIRWHFIPAKSPHFGGLWESAVKSFKHHLLRVVKGALFTYEEFYTFCTEIEAILNSRPISPMSSDPNDLLALTPGHFLIGDSLTSLPDLELRDTPVNRLSQWQHIQQVKQHFWSRWQQEYLNELTVRHKWTKDMPGIQTGALVLLQDEKLPPLQWNMGRVVQCHPGPDNVTRVVTVKTANGTFRRSTKKVSPLPIENSIVGRN
ncbi:uncharacterized protein [Bemisia tabaci]|uniref:uncharacterized protein n=1 Tax=Bemisia tabaci TaxID=7038 RepID=UPI003B28387F